MKDADACSEPGCDEIQAKWSQSDNRFMKPKCVAHYNAKE